MPQTNYKSELNGAQIEAALEAVHGVASSSNNGKVLCIEGGKIAAKSASEWGGGYPEPTGTIQIAANGTVNVKDYETAEVNVPTSITAADEGKVVKNGALVAQTARATDITANGTYDTTENSSVTVNVSGGGNVPVVYSNDGTLAAFIDQPNNRIVWYFMGFTKTASDVSIPSEMLIGQSGLLYSKAYGSDKETQIGQIGFYNGAIRSWTIDTAATLGGTFWGVVYSDGGQGQTNPYSDPPA